MCNAPHIVFHGISFYFKGYEKYLSFRKYLIELICAFFFFKVSLFELKLSIKLNLIISFTLNLSTT